LFNYTPNKNFVWGQWAALEPPLLLRSVAGSNPGRSAFG